MEEYLQRIGISFDTDEQMQEFISLHEESIHDFIRKKRDEFLQQQTVTEEKGPESPEVQDCEQSAVVVTYDECLKVQEVSENPQKKGPEDYQKEKVQNEVFNMELRNRHISLPNGKVNQEYRFVFNVEELFPGVGEFSFEGLEEIGLSYDPETKEIKGVPHKHGDAKIKLKCKRKDWEEGKPVFEREINMIINPDPKSLWNNIPTPTDIDYYKPDCDKEFVKVESKMSKGIFGLGKKELPQKDMVAASQRGRSHAHEGKPRDDDFALYFDEANEWYVMTVADGAGSAQYSRKGSQIACSTVIDVCKEMINTHAENLEKMIGVFNEDKSQANRNEVGKILYNVIGTAVFKSYKNIEKEAFEKGAPLKNYSTTLIVSVCKKFSFGWFVGAFWVGDGGIGIYHKETQYLKVLGEADGGEFAGQTRFLTMHEIMQNTEIYRRIRFDVVDDFTALVLMTDGVTDPKFETDANLLKIERWNDLWNDLSAEVDFADDNEESACQLLSWLDFWSPGNHDDRTIAILF